MSRDRALRKQQQLNNLVAAVTKLAKPGDVIVDFCSGGVMYIFVYMMHFPSLSSLQFLAVAAIKQSKSTNAEILAAFKGSVTG